MNNLGAALRRCGRYREAMVILERAVALEPDYAKAHHILGKCYRQMSDPERAEACQLQALSLQPDYFAAQAELAALRLPGPEYLTVLENLHQFLNPDTYVEIGVDTGRSLALIKPNTRAVGIDPRPQLRVDLPAKTTLFEMTSDDFFSAYDLKEQLLSSPVKLAFIDGLHRFGQVLKDFIEIEKAAAPDSVVILHDVLPLDEVTSLPARQTVFWSGDSWKIVPCLLAERPDLDLFVIPAAPTGLAVVRKLDPGSQVLHNRTEELNKLYGNLAFADFERFRKNFDIVNNNWPAVKLRLSE
jgi:predicted O-methyltransferase YrrM